MTRCEFVCDELDPAKCQGQIHSGSLGISRVQLQVPTRRTLTNEKPPTLRPYQGWAGRNLVHILDGLLLYLRRYRQRC